MPFSTTRRVRSIAIGSVVGLLLGAAATSLSVAGASAPTKNSASELRLGYFDNVTHAPALVALENGSLEKKLGDVELKTSIFNAGPAAVEALLSDSIDATYIGPNPTITAFLQSDGDVQVVSGVASGGAYLVVNKDIKKAKDLKGTTLATPQLGNTQDVALRSYLQKQGLDTDTAGGGDVSIQPQENAVTLTSFQSGDIDGAWVPEPWATRLVEEGGGHILVDEADLWPDGKYVTTDLLVRKDYLNENPAVIQALLEANLDAITLIDKKPSQGEELVGTRIESDTGKALAPELIAASFKNIEFTPDPVSSSLLTGSKNAEKLELPNAVALTKSDLKRLYNLKLLNKVLEAENRPTVSASA